MKMLVSCVPFDGGNSGISTYIRSIVSALSEAGQDLTLIVEKDAEGQFTEYKKIVLPAFCRRPVFSMLYHLFILPFIIKWKAFDCCLATAANRRFFCRTPIFTMAVVHDLSQYNVANKYDVFRTFYIKRILPFFVRRTSKVIAISNSTANDLKRHWHIPEEKIELVYNGLSLPNVHEIHPVHWMKRAGISKPYILYLARLEHPGKNHVGLIEAYNMLPKAIVEKYDLVLPGKEFSGFEAIYEAASRSPYSANIHFTGFIDEADKREAYTNAACFVFPSFSEGFGLPLIEAMHYGIPCACSNTTALGEIGQGAAILFNPENKQEICDAICKILSSDETRRQLVTAGIRRAAEFSWQKAARQMVELAQKGQK